MSKRDIETVCELAAHLAQQKTPAGYSSLLTPNGPWHPSAERCASDAMALQRLGQRAMRALDKRSACEAGRSPQDYSQQELEDEWERVTNQANVLLRPYGLSAKCSDEPFGAECLYIVGLLLPASNGPGNYQDGFRI